MSRYLTMPEAARWLAENANPCALGGNRSGHNGWNTEQAQLLVQRLYAAGALDVRLGAIFNSEAFIRERGGPEANLVCVKLPKDTVKRKAIIRLYYKAGFIHPERMTFGNWLEFFYD